MSASIPGIGNLRPDPAAAWFGQRLCGTLVPKGSDIVEPVSWSLHQWMQGHTCLDLEGVVSARGDGHGALDMIEAPVPAAWMNALRRHPAVACAEPGSMERVEAPMVLEGHRLFLARWRQQEIEVAQALRQRAEQHASWCDDPAASEAVRGFMSTHADGLHPAQRRAVEVGATRRLAVITGGPGTGKTHVAARIIEAVLRTGPHPVLLLAPTGKAAARLQASVRAVAAQADFDQGARAIVAALTAQTVHSAIMRQGGDSLRRARLVVVDETSMIDLERMHALLRLTDRDASIILLGDAHQLASVEAGSVLGDLVADTGNAAHPLAACTVQLVKSHRFPDGSAVARLASAVNGNRPDEVIDLLRTGQDRLRWIEVRTPAQVVRQSIEAMPEGEMACPILCGHRRGPDGAVRMNAIIERERGGGGPRGRYPGRPIMVTVNDELTGLRNGDTGRLRQEGGTWFADFGGDLARVPIDRLPAHETAYALTIHKTQGSEYPHVVVALPARPSPVLTRELLYTAITRTQGPVTVVATEEAIRAAVGRAIQRSSGLRPRLRSADASPVAG
jgi:exodeoxyribonuclease V alpha subunit